MRFAAEHGIHAAFFGVDSTRADPGFYEQVYRGAVEAGAKEVVVVDTLGIASPEAVAELVGRTVEWVGPDVPVHFHGHNDFGLATASRGRRRARRRDAGCRGRSTAWASARATRNLGEVALTLRALYGVESNLRLDRIREVSERVRELSGYELEPWKPVTGETLFRRESGAVASQFHDPPSIEPYSSELVARRARDRARQEERARLDPDQGGGARPRRPRGAARRAARGGEGARHRASAGSSPTTSSASSSMAELRRGRRRQRDQLARLRGAARARRLERLRARARTTELGGAIRTAELTEPGYLHDVFSAWHPLWVGGAAHAELGDELAARGLEYLNTELPDRDALPRRRGGVPAPLDRGATSPSSGAASGDGRSCESFFAERRPRVRRARHRALVDATGSGSRLQGATGGSAAAGWSSSPAACSSRAATGSTETFASRAGARPARAVGAAHRPRARRGRAPGS